MGSISSLPSLGQNVSAASSNQMPTSANPAAIPTNVSNIAGIFQALMPMLMNAGFATPQQNQGQRALNAVNSGGAFNPEATAIQPQYGQQMNIMQDATARLGNLSRFGQPANTMPRGLPQSTPVNFSQTLQQPNANLLPGSGPTQKFAGQVRGDPRLQQVTGGPVTNGSGVVMGSAPIRAMTPAQQYNQNMNQLTPAQRQMQSQQMATGQKPQTPTNPWARKPLTR